MRVTNVRDFGSIVLVELWEPETGRDEGVYFEHHAFADFAGAFDFDFTQNEFDTDGQTVWATGPLEPITKIA